MKRILYMAMTINGFIAKEDDRTEWSQAEWEEYRERVNKAGALIIGRRTYEIMEHDSIFDDLQCTIAVITHHTIAKKGVLSFVSPEEAIRYFKKEKHKEVYITGGSNINALFLKENLIDEIILDIEPIMYGKGTPLMFPESFEAQLFLKKVKDVKHHFLQLHYTVVKKTQ